MASDIKVRIVGDSSAFEKSLGNAKKLSSGFGKELEKEASKAGAGFDKMGEGADGAETRLLGLKDSVDGVATVMQGPGEQGIAAYIQGWADLASGVANFAVPAFKAIVAGGVDQVRSAATATAATASAVAAQVAQWVVMGAQATAQAARVAAAWLISIGPVVAVGAAIAGLVYLFVRNWDTIKDVAAAGARFVKDRFDDLVGFITGLPGRLAAVGKGMFDFLKDAFKSAINWIIRAWNSLEFKVPGFDPPGPIGKIGGFTLGVPDIPQFNNGGIVPGPRGVPRLALVHGGETVLPTHRFPRERSDVMNNINVTVENMGLPPDAMADLISRKIAWAIGSRGGM